MQANYAAAVLEIFKIISEHNNEHYPGKVAAIYLAGGAAVHFYVNARVSDDVDAIMEPYRPAIPADLEAVWTNKEGELKALSFDYQYNPTFGLLDEGYQERAYHWKDIDNNIKLYVLHPIDLVITKLVRYSDSDIADIEALIRLKSFNIDTFEKLALKALSESVGISPDRGLHHTIGWVKELYSNFKSQES
ncbi:DUF6036 family nucleotidyltransferase [Sulfurovum sp.]|uniref:DUF6036 family nucleotidyltransferase n=1 Tax=Sulfurovum sp. TaxID=1969726 RepID=UPI0035668D09